MDIFANKFGEGHRKGAIEVLEWVMLHLISFNADI